MRLLAIEKQVQRFQVAMAYVSNIAAKHTATPLDDDVQLEAGTMSIVIQVTEITAFNDIIAEILWHIGVSSYSWENGIGKISIQLKE